MVPTRDDEGERWVCIDFKDNKLDPLDEIYKEIKRPGSDYQWEEVRSSIPK
jgi:hypothetical protein